MTATQERDGYALKGDATLRLRVEVLDALAARKGVDSVAALARETGISRSTIFRWKAHEVDASGPKQRRLARFLGTTVEALFEEAGE